MPMANTLEDHGRFMRTLVYGRDKTKKTWWALRAAEAGFNIIHLDGDESITIVRNLPVEAQKKILTINLADTAKRAVFARFIATFVRGEPFLWDEQDKVSITPQTRRNPEHSYVYFDQSKFTANDVIVLDTWTSLVGSTVNNFALENDIDLTDIEKEKDGYAMPNFQSRYLDHVLNRIKTFNAHTIIIGHEMIYEKFKGEGRNKTLVGTYTQPISSTGPHGQKLGKFFENVLRFTRASDISFTIDAGGDDSRAGGSRLIPPEKFAWDKMPPQLLLEKLGAKGDVNELCHGAIYIPPGGELELSKFSTTKTLAVNLAGKDAAAPKVIDGSSKPTGLALLRQKQSGG